MKVCVSFMLLLILWLPVKPQDIKVISARNSFTFSGIKIKKNRQLALKDNIRINEKGQVELLYKKWYIKLEEGSYSLDSVFSEQQNKTRFTEQSSIRYYLSESDLLNCELEFPRCLPTNDTESRPLDIKSSSDTVTLHWSFERPYRGKYFIILYNIFDEYQRLYITEEKEFLLEVDDELREAELIVYEIIREDCIRSVGRYIEFQ